MTARSCTILFGDLSSFYGHPDARTTWEVYCDEAVKKQGIKVGESWPSVYIHKELQLLRG